MPEGDTGTTGHRPGLVIAVLGPLRVHVDGRPVAVTARTLQAILLRLVVDPGAAVPVGRLAEAVWGEELPAAYVKTLSVHVSRLRRLLGGGSISHTDGGYALQVDPHDVDAVRLERFAAAGRAAMQVGTTAAAAHQLAQAVALLQGHPAVLDFDVPVLQAEGRRLIELGLAVQEDLFDAQLELGAHADLVAEIERFTSVEPLRERAHGQLMLALHRSGRSAEAVRAFHRHRSRLVDELGLEPGRQLVELERRILDRDPTLDWRPLHRGGARTAPVALPEPLRTDGHELVGRERELAVLGGALDAVRAGASGWSHSPARRASASRA